MAKLMLVWLPVAQVWRFAFGNPQAPQDATLTDWQGVWSVERVAEAEALLAQSGCRLTRTLGLPDGVFIVEG